MTREELGIWMTEAKYNSKTRVKGKMLIETPQNRFLARQNRLLKSAIIETPLGKARITNRPSQEGQVNAVLLEDQK